MGMLKWMFQGDGALLNPLSKSHNKWSPFRSRHLFLCGGGKGVTDTASTFASFSGQTKCNGKGNFDGRVIGKGYNSSGSGSSGDGWQRNQGLSQHGRSDHGPILFLSPTSWPEPNATAAGTRTMALLHHFSSPQTQQKASSLFNSVHFGCGAKIPQSSHHRYDGVFDGVHWHQVKPNRESEMKDLVQKIESEHGPIQAVVFDRFYAEEAFSFQIREQCPDAIRVLDMQDVHSLRIGRQCLVEEMDESQLEASKDNGGKIDESRMTAKLMDQVMNFDPASDLEKKSTLHCRANTEKLIKKRCKAQDIFLRELASVHRSDLVLVCSSSEMDLLEYSWKIPKGKLVPASFFCNVDDRENSLPTFSERTDFVTVGGFKHPPNVDSVRILRYHLWPQIRALLPDSCIHVYGAYPTPEILSMHDEASGFLVHGHVNDLDKALMECRVMLAPLRFGAGIKGKIVDSWRCGCPVVTTPVGAEGMDNGAGQSGDWGGIVTTHDSEFVGAAVNLYNDKNAWLASQSNGNIILNKLFNAKCNLPKIEFALLDAMENLEIRRNSDIVGALMWHQNMRSTEYFSRWIELKEAAQRGKDE